MAESRRYRSEFYRNNIIFLVLVFGVLVLLSLNADKTSRLKVDLSEDQIYSISPATEKILDKLKDDIVVTYYCSENLGSYITNLQRDTVDLFEEFRRLSDGKFEYEVVSPEQERDEYAQEMSEKYMELRDEGETEELDDIEPQPPMDPMQMFSGQSQPSASDLREQREDLASRMAREYEREQGEVYEELLVEDYQEEFENELRQEGVVPFIVEDRTGSSVRQEKVYSAIKIQYLDRTPEIISQYQSLEGIEYDLCHRIVKLTTEEKPTVAFFDARRPEAPPSSPSSPAQPPPPSEYQAVIRYLGELFDVREVALEEGDSIDDIIVDLKRREARKEREEAGEEEPEEDPDENYLPITPEDMKLLKCLIVAQPDQLDSRQVYEINRAISMGVKAVFLVSPFSLDVSPEGVDQQGIPIQTLSPGLEEMLSAWGVSLRNEMLASNTCGVLMLTQRSPGFPIPVQRMLPLPVILAARGEESIDQESPFTNKIPALVLPAATGFDVDQETAGEAGLEVRELVRTGDETWSVEIDPMSAMRNPLQRQMGGQVTVSQYNEELAQRKDPASFRDFIDPVPIALDVQGKIPFIFQGETVPDWPEEEEPQPGAGGARGPGATGLPPGHPGTPGGMSLPPGVTDNDLIPDAGDPLQDAPESGTSNDAASGETEGAAAGAESTPARDGSHAAPAGDAPAAGAASAQDADGTTGEAPGATAAGTAPAEGAPAEGAPAEDAAVEAEPEAEVSTEDEGDEEAADEPRPTADVEPVPGRVVVLASADMLKDGFLRYNREFAAYRMNVNLLRNCVELFGLDDLLLQVRRKTQRMRAFEDDSEEDAAWIQVVNLAGIPLLVALVGIARFVLRRSASVRYEREYIQKHNIG